MGPVLCCSPRVVPPRDVGSLRPGRGAIGGAGVTRRRRTRHLSPTMLDVYVHNLLSMKIFHGVLAGNVHEYSLKSRIGKVGWLLPC
jgi:hypothetical protein